MLNKLKSFFVTIFLLEKDVYGIFISTILFLCMSILYTYDKVNLGYYIYCILFLFTSLFYFIVLDILSKHNLNNFIKFTQIKKVLFLILIISTLSIYFKIEMMLMLIVLAILVILYILYYFLINIFSRFIADIVDIAEHFILCKKIKNLKNYCVFNIESIKFCNYLLIVLIGYCYYTLNNSSSNNILMMFLIPLEILLIFIIGIGESTNYQYKNQKF